MTEKILLLRETFDSLPADIQFKEARRMMRIINNNKPIIISPIGFPDEQQNFHRVEEVVRYLFNNGHRKANNSNVYKVLNRQRKTAYGYRMWYGEN